MNYIIDVETDKMPEFDYETLIKQVIEASLDYEGCPYEAEVNILLTDDEAIREANREFRNLDRSTDVLSFPMVEYPAPGAFDFLEDEIDCFHPETGELLLGDIVISMEHVFAQAMDYGHSVERELAFLVAHSMLHLMGYDHMEDGERKVMEERQEAILTNLGITRS